MSYNSKYKGAEVDAALDLAKTALQEHQDLSGYQPKLVSGTNIKTVNGESILGSGNITISGGSGGSSSGGGSSAYAEVNHGTSDTTFTLTPNTFHVWDEVASLDLSFGAETSGVVNEYLFQFTSGATATTLTLPEKIAWMEKPVIEPFTLYQCSIVNDIALITGVTPNITIRVVETVSNTLKDVFILPFGSTGRTLVYYGWYPTTGGLLCYYGSIPVNPPIYTNALLVEGTYTFSNESSPDEPV